jgi:hypothetical protein
MTGDTIECFNCGHLNPSWAQVCRSCGFAIRPDGPASGVPRGIVPTDQASLISIGGTLGAIALAILVGLFLSGLIPPAPNVAVETPSPTPSPTPHASASAAPSVAASTAPSATPAAPPVGTISFGTGLNSTLAGVTGPTTAFSAGTGFAHVIRLPTPFGVTTIQEEVVHVDASGKETVVQPRASGALNVNASKVTAAFRVGDAGTLVRAFGTGNFILRVYRGAELLAEGHFTLS